MNKFLVVFDANDLETNYDTEEVYADNYEITYAGVLQFFKIIEKLPDGQLMTILHSYAPGFWKKVSLLEEA